MSEIERDGKFQKVDVSLPSYSGAVSYTRDLVDQGFDVKMTHSLEGSNWFWRIEANRPRTTDKEASGE